MIPLAKPLLPCANRLLPYLQIIDSNRYYSNSGPLVLAFEERLGKLFGAPCVTASSATSALTATLIALDLPPKSLVACPSWTFSATPASIIAAGHVPCFTDVNDIGVLHHDSTGCYKPSALVIKAVVVVAPFGAPLDLSKYEDKSYPVIIDAAAGFDAFSTLCKPSKVPVIISTHATKTFGTGEGGFVCCTDEALLKRVRHILNFGIKEDRSVSISGVNGKMSEYHAAVGLAELERWPVKREKWLQVLRWYRESLQTFYGEQREWAASTLALRYRNLDAVSVSMQLKAKGIEASPARYGAHNLEAYRKFPYTGLTNTVDLMCKTVMLPMFVDMKKEEVKQVAEALRLCE